MPASAPTQQMRGPPPQVDRSWHEFRRASWSPNCTHMNATSVVMLQLALRLCGLALVPYQRRRQPLILPGRMEGGVDALAVRAATPPGPHQVLLLQISLHLRARTAPSSLRSDVPCRRKKRTRLQYSWIVARNIPGYWLIFAHLLQTIGSAYLRAHKEYSPTTTISPTAVTRIPQRATPTARRDGRGGTADTPSSLFLSPTSAMNFSRYCDTGTTRANQTPR